ncbi:hypothetical protein MMC12_006900 [Toensbergia leucococca]|nr:hypothetical protein [Toensbergia leucococca]
MVTYEEDHERSRRKSSVVHAERIDNVINANDEVYRRMSVAIPNLAELTSEAKNATESEHDMTFLEGIRLYPKAVGWSCLLSLAIIMEGYDVVLLANFFAFPPFQKKYGVLQPDGTYQVTAAWQSGLTNGAQIGEILGLFVNGIVSERFGYRKTMIGSLCMVICFIFITFFAQNVQMLEAGEILCGIPWGVFQTLTTTYAAEVTPVALRAYLTTYVNLCWVFGQIVGSGVLRGLLVRTDQWAYRVPFAIQWIWPVPIIIGVLFAPESPWWLVRRGRNGDAKKALLRLTSSNVSDFNPDETIAMMVHTNELEKQMREGQSYWDCFKGVDLRRTEIVSMVWIIQTLCGSPMMGYSTYFYEQAGLPTTKSFDMALAQYAIGIVGTVGSWFLMQRVGRRTLYVYGQLIMIVILVVVGGIGCAKESNGTAWATGSLLLIFTFFYDFTVGPVCYSLVAEIPSTRLRIKTVVIARNAYNVAGIIVNIIMPRMLNPSAWNWKGKAAFFWAGTCCLCLLWTYFRLPEPKGLTYGELDVLFEKKISARKFRKMKVDNFRSDNLEVIEQVTSHESEKNEFYQKY